MEYQPPPLFNFAYTAAMKRVGNRIKINKWFRGTMIHTVSKCSWCARYTLGRHWFEDYYLCTECLISNIELYPIYCRPDIGEAIENFKQGVYTRRDLQILCIHGVEKDDGDLFLWRLFV